MQLRLKKSICFSVFVSAFFYKEHYLLLAYAAAFIHEGAHWLAAYIAKVKPKEIKLGILGAKLTLPAEITTKNGIFIHSTGPAFSLVMWGLLFTLRTLFFSRSAFAKFFEFANLVMGIVNILPVFPLDGGIVLKLILATKKGLIRGARISRNISKWLLVLFGTIIFFMSLWGIFNLSIFCFFMFLLFSRSKEACITLKEKRMILSGDKTPKHKFRYMACDAGSELLCLAECISRDYNLIVAAFYKDKFFCDLNEEDILNGIKKYGALCTVKDYIECGDVKKVRNAKR